MDDSLPCRTCGTLTSPEDRMPYTKKDGRSGRTNECKRCNAERQRRYRDAKRGRRDGFDPSTPKRCTRCRLVKPLSDFGPAAAGKFGVQAYCRQCTAECHRQQLLVNPEYADRQREARRRSNHKAKTADPEAFRRRKKNSELKRLYGITIEEYEARLVAQGEVCAVCGEPSPRQALHTEHDHQTGDVRGLTCGPCNRAVEGCQDDPRRALLVAMYLFRWLKTSPEEIERCMAIYSSSDVLESDPTT